MEATEYEELDTDEIKMDTRYHGEIVWAGESRYGILIDGKLLLPEDLAKVLQVHEGFKIDFAITE